MNNTTVLAVQKLSLRPRRLPLLILLLLLLGTTTSTMASEQQQQQGQQPSPMPKTVYLIRHAESDENRRIASLTKCFSDIGKFSLPSSSDVKASTELLNVAAQIDSNVSQLGSEQISSMEDKLQDADFVQTTGIKLVAHSPLLRARETSSGMLGCLAPDKKPDCVDRVVETDLVAEMTPQEWTPFYKSAFFKRVASFESWLSKQPEEVVAVVGHSQYFKAMLGLDFKFGNCDVWRVKYTPNTQDSSESRESRPKAKETTTKENGVEKKTWILPAPWSDLERLYECDVKSSKPE